MGLLLQIAGVVVAGLVALVWLVMLWAGQLNRPKRAPPGSLGLPLIGETHRFVLDSKSLTPQIYAEKRRAKYGDVFTTHHMGYPTVMSVDPEVNKFILQNEGKYFRSNYPRSLRNLFGEGAILRVHGEFHKRLHKIILSFINTSKLKDYVMADVEMLIKRAMANWGGRTVYVEDEAKTLAFNIIINYLIGIKPGKETTYLMEEYRKMIEGVISIPIRIPGTQYARSMKAKENVVKVVQKIIDERRRQPVLEHTDILAAMMAECDEKGQPAFSDAVICNNMANFMGAGEETSPMAIMLAVKYLSDCPKALDQLREEHLSIRKTKQPGESLTWSDYTSMTFTNMVINETLRLCNPASGVLRIATQDVEVKGYFIPKGWLLLPYFRSVHCDETVYPDPLTFNPWRWEKKNTQHVLHPFRRRPEDMRRPGACQARNCTVSSFSGHSVHVGGSRRRAYQLPRCHVQEQIAHNREGPAPSLIWVGCLRQEQPVSILQTTYKRFDLMLQLFINTYIQSQCMYSPKKPEYALFFIYKLYVFAKKPCICTVFYI